ncbi:MAG: hypothetical protein LC794_06800 [Acidobacteria bacterium]|nr:hypothetical protein [Acidobacteriota bacterium]
MLDAENWKIALKVYARDPDAAIVLAFQLTGIKQSLERGRKGIPEAIEAFELAIEGLYPHTDFHNIPHKLYRRAIAGTIKRRQEELVRELGVRF